MIRTITKGPVSVVWWPESSSHGHQLLISIPGEVMVLDGGAFEEFASELAEAVSNCSQDRHGGRGRTHSHQEIQDAFQGALDQLATRDYDAEWVAFEKAVRERKMWGGPVPKSIIFYDADKRPLVAVKDEKTGLPIFYKPRKGVVEEMMTPPDFSMGHVDPSGVSWVRKRALKPWTRWRRLKR